MVESFAITATTRPETVPVPVTTPSAGRSPALAFASKPSSTNEPSSRSRAMRSRAKSLPCSRFFSWYFGAPPRRASSASSRTFPSSIGAILPSSPSAGKRIDAD